MVTITDDDMRAAENGEDRSPISGEAEEVELALAILEDEADRFVALPSKHDIHEWRLMADFADSIRRLLIGI